MRITRQTILNGFHWRPLHLYYWLLFALSLAATQALAQSDSLPSTLVHIYTIQGPGAATPLRGRYLDSFGVVTGVTSKGFYLQDPVGDGNPATSDGLYVYLGKMPTVQPGDCVAVRRGFVDEFSDKTELSRVKSVDPVDWCASRTLTAVSVPLPRLYSQPKTLFERYEGMLVQVENLNGIVQGPTKRFANGEAELALLPTGYASHLLGGRVYQSHAGESDALIFLSSALGVDLPNLRWGDQLQAGASGADRSRTFAVLDQNFGKYQLLLLPGQPLQPLEQPTPQPENAQPTGNDEVTICTVNLYALGQGSAQHPDPSDFQLQMCKRAKSIAETLNGCTIIALQEAGNLTTVQQLADVLRNEFGIGYTGWAGDGYQTDDPEFPLTNGLLWLENRVQIEKLAMNQGCSPINYEVLPGPQSCPSGQFSLFDRPSVLVDLQVSGDWGAPLKLRIISNHWKSKAGDEEINRPRRIVQARHVAGLVQEVVDQQPDRQVVVLGDLNDYYGSEPIETLRVTVQPPLAHLYSLLPALARYTYVYNGASQALDHVLVTSGLLPMVAEVKPIHINADFAYPRQVDLDTVFHASDHDPVQVRLRPAGIASLGGSLDFPGITVQLVDASGAEVQKAVTDDLGEFRLWNVPASDYRVNLTAPPYLRLRETYLQLSLSNDPLQLPAQSITHDGLSLISAAALAVPILVEQHEQ